MEVAIRGASCLLISWLLCFHPRASSSSEVLGLRGLRNVESVFTQLGAIWRNLHGKTKQNPDVYDRDGVGCWPSSRFTPRVLRHWLTGVQTSYILTELCKAACAVLQPYWLNTVEE